MDRSQDRICYVFSDFRLDPAQRLLRLKADGRVLPLTAKAFDTLLYFVQHPRELLDKSTLMSAIWPNVVVEENNLNQCVSVLRRLLGDSRDEHRFIVTVPNRGYQFVADVTLETNGEAPVSPASSTSVPAAPSRKLAWSVAAVAASGAVAVALGYFLWSRGAAERSASNDAKSIVVSAPQTIAVLAFADMSPNQDQGYFADGLSEELSNHLSRLPGLRVLGRSSAFSFKGRNEDLRTIGKALGARHLLEGSVRKAGDRVRITAQLVDSDGTRVWTDTYDRQIGDIFAVQEEVAKSVAVALSVRLGSGDMHFERGGTRNVEAYDAYLAGRASTLSGIPDDVRRGVAQLERATKLDPRFALAWSELALTYEGAIVPERGSAEWNAKALEATSRALGLAPELPSVQSAAGVISMYRKEWAQAERRFHTARDLATGSENVWEKSGWFLVNVGRAREAREYFRRASLAEPLMASYPAMMAGTYEMNGEFDQAAREFTRSDALFGEANFVQFNKVFLALARHDHEFLARFLSTRPAEDALSAALLAHLDEPKAALADLRRTAADPNFPQDNGSLAVLAPWAAYFGDPALALWMMRKLPDDASIVNSVWRSAYRDVRRLPAFKELMRQLGLVDYWRASGHWGDFCRPVGPDDFECTG